MAKPTTTSKKGSTTQAPRTPPKSNVPATQANKGGALVEADLAKQMAIDAGQGVSTRSEDNVVPFIYVLQAQSPQAIRGNKEAYVQGAEGGSIWLRGTKTVFKSEEGILVQPCHFHKEWVEWRPNRGGFVMRHVTDNDSKDPPRGAVQKILDQSKPTRMTWVMPNDNHVVQSRVHVVQLIDEDTMQALGGFVISMSGSNHSASKNWMGLINSKRVPGTDKTAPSYAFLYRLKTVFRTNDDGDWYMWQAENGGEDGAEAMVSLPLYNQGKKIYSDFQSGAIRAETPDGDTDVLANDDTAGDDQSSM